MGEAASKTVKGEPPVTPWHPSSEPDMLDRRIISFDVVGESPLAWTQPYFIATPHLIVPSTTSRSKRGDLLDGIVCLTRESVPLIKT